MNDRFGTHEHQMPESSCPKDDFDWLCKCGRLPSGAQPAICSFAASFDLTPREIQIVTLICCGLKNETIARTLKLAIPTVRFHLRNLHRKTGTNDKLDVVLHIWKHAIACNGAGR
jgi:DNA-binding NarL/FixJ family response regulator